MIAHWHIVYEVARKELLQMLRTKRLLGVGSALLATMVLLTMVLPLAFRDDLASFGGADGSIQNTILLFFLSGIFILSGYFFIQLLPILLTSDAVCAEWNQRTIFLLLSKPVSRGGFVLGKFIGIAVPLSALVGGLLLLDYLAILAIAPGTPGVDEWRRFLTATGLIMMGVLAFSAMSLFFSTLTRSSVASMMLAVTAWIIVFPILANVDLIIQLVGRGMEAFASPEGRGWSQYLSPGGAMRTATDVLVPGGGADFFGGAGIPSVPWIAALALLGHTALWVGLSLLVVRRRNFE